MDTRPCHFALLALAVMHLFSLVRVPAAAATLHVAADGSGQYATIQDAVDAASPGDVIELGPGLFDDYTIDETYPYYDFYVSIETDDLTLRGQGMDVTVIGQETPEVHEHQTHGVRVDSDLKVHLENLTFRLNDWSLTSAVSSQARAITVRHCAFRNSSWGLRTQGTSDFEVVGCEFTDLHEGIKASIDEAGSIRDCLFVDMQGGLYANYPGHLVVEDCLFDGADHDTNTWGVCTASWGTVTLRRCTFVHHPRSALLVDGDLMRLEDCVIEETTGHGIEMSGGVLGGTGNVLTSESIVLATLYAEFDGFRDNHFLASGDGMLFVSYAVWDLEPRILDLEHNWWGTDDTAEIAALIHDSRDDPEIDETVDFVPHHSQPVPTGKRSLSQVKSLFR